MKKSSDVRLKENLEMVSGRRWGQGWSSPSREMGVRKMVQINYYFVPYISDIRIVTVAAICSTFWTDVFMWIFRVGFWKAVDQSKRTDVVWN